VPSHFDTLVAPITGASRAAVAVVRLSGPKSWEIANRLFNNIPTEPLKLQYGHFKHGDDGYVVLFEQGRSYTGDQSAECSIHGSPASVRALIELAIQHGARYAEPGEFTQRAFLNGRIDLTQAEAVRDTIEAETEVQLRIANRQREGALYEVVKAIRDKLLGVLASIEASVDFSEEIGDLDRGNAADQLDDCAVRIQSLIQAEKRSRLFRNGFRVALVGPPNAGKSSLLNAILGTERSIVTAVPGTTRDFVEESIEFDGLPITFLDTAGLRQTEDPVEQEGINRALKIARTSDIIVYLYDAQGGYSEEDSWWIAELEKPVRIVANKCDLLEVEGGLSAKTGEGVRELLHEMREVAGEEPSVAVNARHRQPLEVALADISMARATLVSDRPVDLATVSIQSALRHLGEITGETADPDMISRIFHDFCIGK